MKSIPLNIFPTAISEFYVAEESFFEELIETEKRIGNISDKLNLATVPNITSSYGCNQVRLKIKNYITQNEVTALNYEWSDDTWVGIKESICAKFLEAGRIYVDQHFGSRPAFAKVMNEIEVSDIWIVRYKEGDYNYFHTHPGAVLSGVLFLEVPPQLNYEKNFPDGHLSLINDGVYDESTLRFNKTYFVQPEVGKLVIFPASLGHLVYPFKGPGTRIALAVNWDKIHK